AGNANQAFDVVLLLRPGHAPVKVLQVVRPEDETVSDFRTDKVITHPVDEQLVTGQDVECQDTFPALNVLPGGQQCVITRPVTLDGKTFGAVELRITKHSVEIEVAGHPDRHRCAANVQLVFTKLRRDHQPLPTGHDPERH